MPDLVNAKNIVLVLQWECGKCGFINHYSDNNSEKALEAKAAVAEKLGVDPESLAAVPSKVFCRKCEELNFLPADAMSGEDIED